MEHEIYHDDVLVEYPQSGERIRGRHTIQAVRSHHPAKLGFTIRRIQGLGDLWITEYVLSYNEQPTQTVSILEFCEGKVAHETQYFADPFEPPAWRAQWVEHQEKEFNKKNEELQMAACSPKNRQPEEPSCWRFCWRDQPGNALEEEEEQGDI